MTSSENSGTGFLIDLDQVKGKHYVLASPSIGAVPQAAVRHLRLALWHLSNQGGRWAADVSSSRGSVMAARNHALDGFHALSEQYAKEGNGVEIEGMFWVDDDILMPTHALTMMAASGYDFVTGVYCQRGGDYMPLVGKLQQKDGQTGFLWALDLPENALMKADGCGFGIVYTSAKLLRALPKNAFEHRDGVSEDLSFCLNAKDAGFQLYCLTGLLCGHLSDQSIITYGQFREHWAKKQSEQQAKDSAA